MSATRKDQICSVRPADRFGTLLHKALESGHAGQFFKKASDSSIWLSSIPGKCSNISQNLSQLIPFAFIRFNLAARIAANCE